MTSRNQRGVHTANQLPVRNLKTTVAKRLYASSRQYQTKKAGGNASGLVSFAMGQWLEAHTTHATHTTHIRGCWRSFLWFGLVSNHGLGSNQ